MSLMELVCAFDSGDSLSRIEKSELLVNIDFLLTVYLAENGNVLL